MMSTSWVDAVTKMGYTLWLRKEFSYKLTTASFSARVGLTYERVSTERMLQLCHKLGVKPEMRDFLLSFHASHTDVYFSFEGGRQIRKVYGGSKSETMNALPGAGPPEDNVAQLCKYVIEEKRHFVYAAGRVFLPTRQPGPHLLSDFSTPTTT